MELKPPFSLLFPAAGGPGAGLFRVQGIQADRGKHRIPNADENGMEGRRGIGIGRAGNQKPRQQVSAAPLGSFPSFYPGIPAGSRDSSPERGKLSPAENS